MIQIVFGYNREVMNFLVKDREIFYTDRKWRAWIRCLPPPENLINKVKMSRNKIPQFVSLLFSFTDEEMKQYEAATTEEELADIIVNDAKLKGCKLIKKEIIKKEIIKNESG